MIKLKFDKQHCIQHCGLCETIPVADGNGEELNKYICASGEGLADGVRPDILIVGESPGEEEELKGAAFQGPAGMVLLRCLQKAGVPLKNVAFTNAIRCRPTTGKGNDRFNRDPTDNEIAACKRYLIEEVKAIDPKLIITVGNMSRFSMTGHKSGVTKIHGTQVKWRAGENGKVYDVMHTFHPSYVGHACNFGADDIMPEATLPGQEMIGDLRLAWDLVSGTVDETERIVVNDDETFDRMVADIEETFEKKKCRFLSLDTETVSFYPYRPNSDLIMISLSVNDNRGYSIPINHPESNWNDRLRIGKVHSTIKRWLTTYPLVGHNFKFDALWLLCQFGIEARNLYMDTMSAHHLLYAGARDSDLSFMMGEYLSMRNHKNEFNFWMEEATKKMSKEEKAAFKNDWRNVPLSVLAKYAADDAIAVFRLVSVMEKQLKELNMLKAYHVLYRRTFWPLVRMEYNGLRVDAETFENLKEMYPKLIAEHIAPLKATPYWEQFRRKFGTKVETVGRMRIRNLGLAETEGSTVMIEGASYRNLGYVGVNDKGTKQYRLETVKEFSPTSSKQRIEWIYRVMALPAMEDEEGDPIESFNKNTRPALFEWCAENKKTKELKTLEDLAACVKQNWLYGSHCKNMLRMLEPRDLPEPSHTSHLKKLPAFNTVHPSYQLMTRTGRASAKEPPIHNIPGKADVKKMYVSRWMNRGGTIMLVDYSQFELRVMAALSGDEAMMSIFEEDRDIHTAIAAMCLGVPESEITKDIRKRYKAVVFGMIYGRSAKAMAATEKMTIEEAQEIIDSVFRRFKGMANWIENQQLEAQRTNEVWTPWGRRRIMPKAFGFEKGRLNRVAVNTPIQGSASDTTLTAMGAIDPRLSGEGCRSLQIAFIHDALMFDVFPGELAKVHKIVREEMSDNVQKRAPWFKVPAKVEFQVGTSWGRQITFNRREDGVFIFEAEEEVGKEFWKKDFNLLKEALVKSDIKRFYGYETREEGKKRFHQMFAEPA